MKVTLADVLNQSQDKADPQETSLSRYVGLEHIEKETGKLSDIGNAKEVVSTKSVFCSGDILYGKLRPYLNKVVLVDFEGICSTDILVLRTPSDETAKFLKYRLLSSDFVSYANQNVSGVQHPRVNAKTVFKFLVKLPPLHEQKRIVEKLELLLSGLGRATQALQAAREKLKNYRRAVLKAAVEGELSRAWREENRDRLEPASELLERILAERRKKWEEDELAKMRAKGKEPKDDTWKEKYKEPEGVEVDGLPKLPLGWVWATVEQLSSGGARSIQSGPFGSGLLHSEFQDEGVLAIGIDNVLEARFSMGSQNRVSQKKYLDLKKFTAHPLDVLITVMATVGRCCVVPKNLETAIITKHVYRITPESKFIDSFYLMHCLQGAPSVREQIFDSSLEESANLPAPEVLAVSIIEDLESALEAFREIAEELETSEGVG